MAGDDGDPAGGTADPAGGDAHVAGEGSDGAVEDSEEAGKALDEAGEPPDAVDGADEHSGNADGSGDAHVVARADELEDGDRLVAQLAGREVAVFRHRGEFYAYVNWCFHQGGPCCEGTLSGTAFATYDREAGETEVTWEREGEILNCPWHGWEYDLLTGECLSRRGVSLPSYPVEVRDGDVVVTL